MSVPAGANDLVLVYEPTAPGVVLHDAAGRPFTVNSQGRVVYQNGPAQPPNDLRVPLFPVQPPRYSPGPPPGYIRAYFPECPKLWQNRRENLPCLIWEPYNGTRIMLRWNDNLGLLQFPQGLHARNLSLPDFMSPARRPFEYPLLAYCNEPYTQWLCHVRSPSRAPPLMDN